MNNLLRMTVVQRISNCLNNLHNLILVLTLMMIFRFTQLTPLHILHNDIKEFFIVVDLVYFDDVWMLESEENLALVKKCSDVLLADTFFVDDLYCILVEVLAEDGFLDLCKCSLT